MKSFDDWFCELISNEIWFTPASMHHKPETFRDVANKVYMEYLASENFPPIQVARVYVFNKLGKIKPDKVVKPWHVQEDERKAKELNPLADPNCPHCKGSGGVKTGEDEYSTCPCVNPWKPADPAHVDKCVKEFFDMLKDSPMVSYRPQKEKIFFNGKPLDKIPPHPITSPQEAYEKDRHFEYIKANFHPLTREKLPGWIPEKEFNRLYDEGLI